MGRGRLGAQAEGEGLQGFPRVAGVPASSACWPQSFATETLRTLCLACKEVDEDVYEEWRQRHQEASILLQNRAQALQEVYEEMEQSLQVGGAGGGAPHPSLPGSWVPAQSVLAHSVLPPSAPGSHSHRGQAAGRCPRNHQVSQAGEHQSVGPHRGQARWVLGWQPPAQAEGRPREGSSRPRVTVRPSVLSEFTVPPTVCPWEGRTKTLGASPGWAGAILSTFWGFGPLGSSVWWGPGYLPGLREHWAPAWSCPAT